MVTSEVYTDIVGSVEGRSWPRAFDGCIAEPCTNCGAGPYQMCMYSPSRLRRVPCVARTRGHSNH